MFHLHYNIQIEEAAAISLKQPSTDEMIKVGQFLGVFNTLMIVIGTGFLGALLARSQGLRVLQNIQHDLNAGIIPSEGLFDGLFILCGGILLLTPGLLTDSLGFLCLIPYSRNMAKSWTKKRFKRIIEEGRATSFTTFHF